MAQINTDKRLVHWETKDMASAKCTVLFVNGSETNVYYFSTYSAHDIERAKRVAHLIMNGDIFPEDGNWKLFDIHSCVHVNLESAQEVDINPNWRCHIFESVGSPTNDKAKVLEKIRSRTNEPTQWSNMYGSDLVRRENIGVKFYPFGYTVFFY